MAKVFISYRRSDAVQVAGRIYDRLVASYGQGSVFKDVDSIPLGMDFRQAVHRWLDQCDVLLAVIGQGWVDAADGQGHRRLDNPDDLVRIEIETALNRDVRVLPLLVDGARMPEPHELPEALACLALRNGTAVRPDPDFHRDMERVIAAIGPPSTVADRRSTVGTLASNVILIDASLDPQDSPYQQTVEDGRRTIRPKQRTKGDQRG